MDRILLDLGIIKIYWYSAIMFVALLVGAWLVLREAKKWKIPEDFIINLAFYMIPIALVGARLYFVVFHWDYYGENLIEIFQVWNGGLAIHGALLAGFGWLSFYCHKYKVPLARMTDIIVVSLLLGQALGRWGNFMNQEAFGPATTLEFLQNLHLPEFIINGMHIGGIYYQPTFLYESIWCILGFFIILGYRKYPYLKNGQLTSFYLIWYSIGRFFIEGLRTDSLMFFGLKQAQIVSVILIIIGLGLFLKSRDGSRFKNLYHKMEDLEHVNF